MQILFLFLAVFMSRSFWLFAVLIPVPQTEYPSAPSTGICSSVQLYIVAVINLLQESISGSEEKGGFTQKAVISSRS